MGRTRSDSDGRPLAPKLSVNDAELVRCAVRATTRYFGIPIGQLGGGAGWVGEAMRSGNPMTATTAERLFRLAQQFDLGLIGRKSPQGPSLAETQRAIDSHTADPKGCPLYQTPTLEYLNPNFPGTRTVERYARAFPGSVLFVLPGSAQAVAESLADEINHAQIYAQIPGQIGRSERRKLVEFLSFYFGLAERPLKTPKGQKILGTLNVLGIEHNAQTLANVKKALPQDNFADPAPTLDWLIEAETQREKILAETAAKKRPRSKRKVIMRRIKDSLK